MHIEGLGKSLLAAVSSVDQVPTDLRSIDKLAACSRACRQACQEERFKKAFMYENYQIAPRVVLENLQNAWAWLYRKDDIEQNVRNLGQILRALLSCSSKLTELTIHGEDNKVGALLTSQLPRSLKRLYVQRIFLRIGGAFELAAHMLPSLVTLRLSGDPN